MSPTPDTQPTADALRAELAETEEKLRKLVRHLDQLGRTEFRDRAQRLKQMRDQRAELEAEIDTLKTRLKEHE
jgi:chromosome segregation ATPase